LRIDQIEPPPSNQGQIWICSAVPRGARADWMVEKLSELGVRKFVPLLTDRGVPREGSSGRQDRWRRLAEESAEQSRRIGVMSIDAPVPLMDAIAAAGGKGWWLSPRPDAEPIARCIAPATGPIALFIGPEGGWSDRESDAFGAAGFTAVRLTGTILRVETAAIAAAAVLRCGRAGG
jgi:16S rRNA (uracil1498-N3)-methyltransferase